LQVIGVPVRHTDRDARESQHGAGLATATTHPDSLYEHWHEQVASVPQVKEYHDSAIFHPAVFAIYSERYAATIATFARYHGLRHVDACEWSVGYMTPVGWTESQAEEGIERLVADPFSPRWLLSARASY
jgi:hypothetical protein